MLEQRPLKQHTPLSNWKKMTKHPFFGVFLSLFVMILIRILGNLSAIPSGVVDVFAIVWIYIIIGLGFTLLLGYTGLASLGTAGFIGVGSYVVAYVLGTAGMPLIVAFLLGIIIAIGLGTVVGFISLRIEGMYLAIITLGLSEILVEVFKFWIKVTKGLVGFQLDRYTILGLAVREEEIYFILVLALILTMFAVLNLINSPTGRAMLSIKNSTSAAQAMGISILKYRLLSFIVSTVLAVIGGMLYMMYTRSTIPNVWNIALSLNILAAVVIGGAKSIWGVSLGTIFIFGFNQLVLARIPFFARYGNASLFINGALIILVVMFYPGGIVRMFHDVSRLMKKTYQSIVSKVKEYRYGPEE